MSLEEKYPALRNLMSAGFNQDFWDIDGSPEGVVSAFAHNPLGTSNLGEAAPGLQRLVGESILTAYVADQRLRLGTANVALVSEPSEGATGWRIELDPVTS